MLGVPRDEPLPERMTMSNDVDAYPKTDPGRAFDLEKDLDQGSPFDLENGFYFDPVSPDLPTLPEGWESRLFRINLPGPLTLYFLDPNDAAVSKYARAEPRDREWLQAGLGAGVLSPAIIEYRMRETTFIDADEETRAKAAFAEDRTRLLPKRNARRTSAKTSPTEVPELPGCMSDGKTYQEAVSNVETVIAEWIETAVESGRSVPDPKGKLMYA